MQLSVIGAGFGRTGTDSMREALTILGLGPCHHMFEVTANPVMKARWRALMAGEAPDWPALFQGYRSCVDWPAAFYWRELAALNPAAKVVLTWRTPESWWESFEKTILAHYRVAEDRASVGVRIVEKVFGDRIGDRDHAIALYEANVAAVRREIPPGRLIVHGLGDGWGPLCAGLGLAEPQVPYPSRNSTADMRARFSVAPLPE
ncbi:MAG: sulfotransferase family protein [Rhodobacteraceae bacterium]|nr:sulfotransferase family protein [Paracoccaceae bacterium]